MGRPVRVDPEVEVADVAAGGLDGVDLDRRGERVALDVGRHRVKKAAEDVVPGQAGLLLLVIPPGLVRLDDVADRHDMGRPVAGHIATWG